MPVSTFVTSAATFLYALSSLFSGTQNAAVSVPLALRSARADEYDVMPFPQSVNNHSSSEFPPIFQRRLSSSERLIDLKARARGLVTLLTLRPSLLGGDSRRQNGNGLSDTEHQFHDQQMAETIFQTLISHSYRHNSSSGLLTDEITYYDKETVATIFLDPSGNVSRCRLIEVVEPEDAERVLQMIANKNKPIERATFRTMLTIITACQALEPKTQTTTPIPEPSALRETAFGENMPPDYNMWSIISGILPGTKWCGLGDISSSYDDLGPERNLDKCCRAHDHCPIKVKAFRSRYGLVNWSLYTKSHCECDSLLYDCLKKAGSPVAEMLGNFYFNVLRVQCVDEEEQRVCAARDPATKECKMWQPDSRQPKRMLFRTVRRQF